MRSWRRLHGSDVIAQVEPVAGFGTWRVSVWNVTDPKHPTRHLSEFQLLTEALDAADALARQQFGHTCDKAYCGQWLARAG
jgi:hypothetical protein